MPLGISRLCQNLVTSATLAMDTKAKELKAAGHTVISFAAGEPNFDTPVIVREAMKDALDRGMTRYTAVPGTLELKDAIIQKLARDNDLHYERNEIIVSNGAKHSLSTALQAILNVGEEVIIPSPCWVSYPEMVRMAGGTPVFLETREEDGFLPSAQAIAALLTPRTKALLLTTPNNPCGCTYPRELLLELAHLCEEKDFYIIADEIYENLIYDGAKHVSIASLTPGAKARTLVVNGVSKSYAMTGFRIGYLAGPRDVVAAMTKYQSQATSAPNSPAQHAAAVALTMDQSCVSVMRAAFEERRNVLCAGINAIDGLECHTPSGAFYVMMNIQALLGSELNGHVIASSADFCNAILEHEHVVMVPGSAFMAEGYCRLSYAISMEDIRQGLLLIQHFANSLTRKEKLDA